VGNCLTRYNVVCMQCTRLFITTECVKSLMNVVVKSVSSVYVMQVTFTDDRRVHRELLREIMHLCGQSTLLSLVRYECTAHPTSLLNAVPSPIMRSHHVFVARCVSD